MHMISVLFDVGVDMRMNRFFTRVFAVTLAFGSIDTEMFTTLAFDARTLNHMPEVRDDTHLGKQLAVLVEVDAPRIASAFREHFEDVPDWMITPHPSVHPLAFRFRDARLANIGGAEHSVTAVKPSVGTPRECVESFMRIHGKIPAV